MQQNIITAIGSVQKAQVILAQMPKGTFFITVDVADGKYKEHNYYAAEFSYWNIYDGWRKSSHNMKSLQKSFSIVCTVDYLEKAIEQFLETDTIPPVCPMDYIPMPIHPNSWVSRQGDEGMESNTFHGLYERVKKAGTTPALTCVPVEVPEKVLFMLLDLGIKGNILELQEIYTKLLQAARGEHE